MDHVPYLIEDNPTVLAACKAWEVKSNAVNAARWTFVKEVGGVGYRGRYGIQTVMFPNDRDIPTPWQPLKRQAGDIEPGTVECKPIGRTKEGRALKERMREQQYVDCFPYEAARAMGHEGETLEPYSGRLGRVRVACLKKPQEIYVVTVPLLADEKFTPPTGVRELTRGEFVALVEAHNAAVAEEKEAA